MHGWINKLKLKTRVLTQRQGPAPQEERRAGGIPEAASAASSSTSPPDLVGASSSSTPLSPSSSLSCNIPASPSKPGEKPVTCSRSAARWSRTYDVCVAHSSVETDIEEARSLVAFLEMAPRCLRCFLWHRDSIPGAAIFTELCRVIKDSHCNVLLITPHFIAEDWCEYILQQSLASGPLSHRTIPVIQNLEAAQYPKVLRCIFYVDLSRDLELGYKLVCRSVLQVLHDMVTSGKT